MHWAGVCVSQHALGRGCVCLGVPGGVCPGGCLYGGSPGGVCNGGLSAQGSMSVWRVADTAQLGPEADNPPGKYYGI